MNGPTENALVPADIDLQLKQLCLSINVWVSDLRQRLIGKKTKNIREFVMGAIGFMFTAVRDEHPNPEYPMEWADRTRRLLNELFLESDLEDLEQQYHHTLRLMKHHSV
jgi:hypothetical protein